MATVPTLPGITSTMVPTDRLNTHVLFSGPEKGLPLVFVHGNFSAATYFEETMLAMPENYRCIAPDLRGYGDSEDRQIDATRGARDWSLDLKALSDVLGDRPAHLVGWSMGAAAITQFYLDFPGLVSSLTLISPVSPYGFGGTKDELGTPCYEDFAGSGGGTVNPEFVKRIVSGDRTAEDANSPRNVINTFYYKAPFRAEREEAFLDAALLERTGEDRYPGDLTPSGNWPNVAPGVWGPINAGSPKHYNTSSMVGMEVKPPIFWARGDADQIVSDQSFFDFGTLGKLGFVPGWPGDDVFPPQPMVAQTRSVLTRYAEAGGRFVEAVFDAGHSPHIEQPDAFNRAFLDFLRGV